MAVSSSDGVFALQRLLFPSSARQGASRPGLRLQQQGEFGRKEQAVGRGPWAAAAAAGAGVVGFMSNPQWPQCPQWPQSPCISWALGTGLLCKIVLT